MTDLLPIRRALLSVSDKAGLLDLARALAAHGAELLSTGGTAAALRAEGIAVTEVSDFTGFPEILDGRVKTLLPQIHGGLLGRRDDASHLAEMQAYGIAPIDLVAVNLYPFEATVASGAGETDCVENIDIGGPAMIRSAAKNHAHVVVLTEPAQYAAVIDAAAAGGTGLALRRQLAAEAYARTAAYDAAIAAWMQREAPDWPRHLALAGRLAQALRYGENPQQRAALYLSEPERPGAARARQVQGKELSYNNLNDSDAAYECVAEFDAPAIVIVKHANPCGVAMAATLPAAWEAALRCDPVSAFGGVVAANRVLDGETAERIAALFTEVVIAPDATPEALAVFARKKSLRLLLAGALPDPHASGLLLRPVAGGFLAQTRDAAMAERGALRCVTRRPPTNAELDDLLFAARVCKHVKSNAIVFARGGATTGIGAGQMSRLDAARIATLKAAEAARAAGVQAPLTAGSVVASDAFFPFADGVEAALAAGATAIIQPGGSLRDPEVIAAADAAGAAMVFTGLRHFRH